MRFSHEIYFDHDDDGGVCIQREKDNDKASASYIGINKESLECVMGE